MDKIHGLFFRDARYNAMGHIVAEIYKDAIYEPFLYGRKDLTIFDLGANVGVFSYYASQYAKKIYAIEPSKEHLEVLNKTIEFNNLQGIVTPYNFALSIKDDKGKLSHYSNTTMYSLYENLATGNNTGLQKTGEEDVSLKRLDTFFREENIEHIDFMKMDVEGVEYEILGSDSFSKVAPKIDEIVIEVHSYSGRNPNQIVDSLKLNGYEVSQIPNDALLLHAKR